MRDAHLCDLLCAQFGNDNANTRIVVDCSTVDIRLYKELLEDFLVLPDKSKDKRYRIDAESGDKGYVVGIHAKYREDRELDKIALLFVLVSQCRVDKHSRCKEISKDGRSYGYSVIEVIRRCQKKESRKNGALSAQEPLYGEHGKEELRAEKYQA